MGAKHCEKSNDLVEGATRLSVESSFSRALGGLRKSHEANNWILELFLTSFFRNCVENRANLQRRLHTLQFSIEVGCASGSEIEITFLSKINLWAGNELNAGLALKIYFFKFLFVFIKLCNFLDFSLVMKNSWKSSSRRSTEFRWKLRLIVMGQYS